VGKLIGIPCSSQGILKCNLHRLAEASVTDAVPIANDCVGNFEHKAYRIFQSDQSTRIILCVYLCYILVMFSVLCYMSGEAGSRWDCHVTQCIVTQYKQKKRGGFRLPNPFRIFPPHPRRSYRLHSPCGGRLDARIACKPSRLSFSGHCGRILHPLRIQFCNRRSCRRGMMP